jgi:O-antigen/teichoic acid export membrane protein
MQAHRQFKKLATYIAFSGMLRLVCFFTIYLLFTRLLNLSSTLTSIYTWPLVIAIVVGIIPIMADLVNQKLPGFAVVRRNIFKIMHYGKWVAISALCNSFIYRGVQFILATRTSTYELGIFSAGFVFTLAFSPINAAVRTVFFPYVTAYAKNEIINHLRRMKKVFPVFLILTALGIATLAIIQVVFLGDRYTQSLPVFLITSTALTISVFLGIASMLVHTIMKPEIDAYTNIGRVIASSLLTFSLAPALGALGGAIAYALPIVIGEIFMVLYVRKLIYEKP